MEKVIVRIQGEGPCGMRMKGGGRQPIVVTKLHKRSRAHSFGLQVGDQLLSINGFRCQGMDLQTAVDLVQYSSDLDIELLRNRNYQPREIETDTDTEWQFSHSMTSREHPSPKFTTRFRTSVAPSDGEESSSQVPLHLNRVSRSGNLSSHTPRFTTTNWKKDSNEEAFKTTPTQHFSNMEKETGINNIWSLERSGRDVSTDPDYITSYSSQKPTVYEGAEKISNTWQPNFAKSNFEMQPSNIDTTPTRSESSRTPLPFASGNWQDQANRWEPPTVSTLQHSTVPQWRPNQPQTMSSTSQQQSTQPQWHPTQDKFLSPRDKSNLDDEDMTHEVVIWCSKPTLEEPAKPISRPQNQMNATPVHTPSSFPKPQFIEPYSKPSAPGYTPIPPEKKTFSSNDFQPTSQLSSFIQRPISKVSDWQASSNLGGVSQLPRNIGGANKFREFPSSDTFEANRGWNYQLPVEEDANISTSSTWLDSEPKESAPNELPPDSCFLTRGVTSTGNGSVSSQDVHPSKKKLFGDSSFYADPEHKYPTIEEQIKMARKVAQLLTSAANRNARGQKMFLKRQELASKWTSEYDSSAPRPRVAQFNNNSQEKSNIMSAEEIERMRLYEEKSCHNVVSFDLCSRLANELHEVKGRGGKLFAKRRAKAEQWVAAENDPVQPRLRQPQSSTQPEFVKKLRSETSMPPPVAKKIEPPQQPPMNVVEQTETYSANPTNRLKDMINLPKAAITPWDSVVEYGNVEKAFEHLRHYDMMVAAEDGGMTTPSFAATDAIRRAAADVARTNKSGNVHQPQSFNRPQVPDSNFGGNITIFSPSRELPWSNDWSTAQNGQRQQYAAPISTNITGSGYRPVQFRSGARTGIY